MANPDVPPGWQPSINKALPKNAFVGLESMPDVARQTFLTSPEGKAVQFAAAEIDRDLQLGSPHLSQALCLPDSHRLIRAALKVLGNSFAWILALDPAFTQFHLHCLMMRGVSNEPIYDGWNKFLIAFTSLRDFVQMTFPDSSVPSLKEIRTLELQPPDGIRARTTRLRDSIAQILAQPVLSVGDDRLLQMSKDELAQIEARGLTPVESNDELFQLFLTEKGAVGENLRHPLWQQISQSPEFRELYLRAMNCAQVFLRVLTQERLKIKTPERVFEASFILPGSVVDRIDGILEMARAIRPSFMTSPASVPGLPEGQRMMIFVTSDQRFQSPDQLRDEIRNIAAKHAIQLPDIDVRWNQ